MYKCMYYYCTIFFSSVLSQINQNIINNNIDKIFSNKTKTVVEAIYGNTFKQNKKSFIL